MNDEMERLERRLDQAGIVARDSAAPVPTERLDEAIRTGLRRASEERRPARRLRVAAVRCGAAAAAALLFLAVSIRVFPGFALALSQVPGMDAIVRLIAYDRGLATAVRNDYYQPIGVSQTQDGVTLTVDGVIADEGRIVLFYTVTDPEGNAPEIESVRFVLPDGSAFEAGYGWWSPGEEESRPTRSGHIDVQYETAIEAPRAFILQANMGRAREPVGGTWEIPIEIEATDPETLRTEYIIDRVVEMEGQRVTFKRAILYPTRIAVEAEFDEANTKEIFSFADLKLIGDNGEPYSETGGILYSGRTRVYYFEGSSFDMPNSLTLTGTTARALDKDQLELVIDTERSVALKKPDDKLAIAVTRSNGGDVEIRTKLTGIDPSDRMIYNVGSGRFYDTAGRPYDTGGGSYTSRTSEPEEQIGSFEIPDEDYVQPLTFRISNYPAYIREPFEIRIR